MGDDLVSSGCLKERNCRRRKQPLIFKADNENALAAGFHAAITGGHTCDVIGGSRSLDILLKTEGKQRQPALRIPICTVKYQPYYPNRLFHIKKEPAFG